ncbi:MAG: hypothetical protein HY292_14255 [Planctomycetes bacterium]|nr:hypothetical protein [Planctomycetota bacterium]
MKTFLSIVLTLASVASLARAQNSNCIWIPDVGTGTVTLLGMDGTVRGVFAVGGAPRGAAVDAAGNAWISRLTERGVVRIAADGSRIDTFTAGITSKTCAIDRDGNVWITNQSLDLITKMTPAGIVLGDFPTGDGPRVVAIDRNNDVWLTCKFSGEVLKYDSLGNPYFRTQVGLGPRGIAIAEDGTAWVANLDSSTVSHLSAAGILLGDYPVPASPGGIAVDRRGNIWIASGLADVVTILRPDGTVLRSILTMPLGGHGALNVAPDGDGNMWVVCKLSSTVLKFNLDGRLERRTDLNTLSRPEPFGDLTGALRAKFANPSDDEDGDGLTNEIELGQGTNPFLAIDPSVRNGNVNGARGPVDAVLKVNGTNGGDVHRFRTSVGQPLAVRVKVSSAGPNPARFALYAFLGEVDSTTISVQPFGIGTSAIPTPLNGPNPRLVVLYNSLGFRHALGTPRITTPTAPATLAYPTGIRSRTIATIQGFIQDAAAPGGHGLAITNAITIDAR